jgi:hypothetical protein
VEHNNKQLGELILHLGYMKTSTKSNRQNPKDIQGYPAGILLYNTQKRTVLLAYEKTSKYAMKNNVPAQTRDTVWSMAWGKRNAEDEGNYPQTALREHSQELGTPLPEAQEIEHRSHRVTIDLGKAKARKGQRPLVKKGVVYLLEVSEEEMERYCNEACPTDAKTVEVKAQTIEHVLEHLWVRWETRKVLKDHVVPLMRKKLTTTARRRRRKGEEDMSLKIPVARTTTKATTDLASWSLRLHFPEPHPHHPRHHLEQPSATSIMPLTGTLELGKAKS